MAEPKFVDDLNAFEKDDINAKTMKLIRDKYINNKEIDPDESKVSMAFTWIVLEVNHLLHRGGICHSRHSRRECKIFASGVNFSRNNAVCYINESKKLHFILISSLKLLTYY